MKSSLFILFLFVYLKASPQSVYWQQQLRYTINAELNDEEKSITGTETIVYKNNSPVTHYYIWFHIWPNAYKNNTTALYQQISRNAKKKVGEGSIEGLAFTINGKPAQTAPHPQQQYIDIIKLLLNEPLLPGDSITIATPFKVWLPPYFSRSGYANGEFMACQWYPKPAVFDRKGWHEFPYLDMGEFYSEFADYTVNLTLPSGYVVGATGSLQTKEELDAYKEIGAKNFSDRKGKGISYVPLSKNEKKTLTYYAEQVPDFAWFADKKFVIQYDTIQLPSGRVIDGFSYYHNKKFTLWKSSISYIKDAVKRYSRWIGEYDYPVVQVVEGPSNNYSGGMEYPMITLITSPDAKEEKLDAVIAHEIGHNWFMAMLGSNERSHTWMDEGLNTYYQFRYEAEKYRSNSILGSALPPEMRRLTVSDFLSRIYNALEQFGMYPAMDQPADRFFSIEEYGMVSYIKAALWMYLLELSVGPDKVDAAFRNYFNKWKFKHPYPEDMQKAFEEALGGNLDAFFRMTKKTGKFE